MKDKITNPHDSFFKAVLGKREAAIDFFKHYIPSGIQGIIAIDTLEIKKDSFIAFRLLKYIINIRSL